MRVMPSEKTKLYLTKKLNEIEQKIIKTKKKKKILQIIEGVAILGRKRGQPSSKLIEKLNKLQIKLDYIISCNGYLTAAEYQSILRDLTRGQPSYFN